MHFKITISKCSLQKNVYCKKSFLNVSLISFSCSLEKQEEEEFFGFSKI